METDSAHPPPRRPLGLTAKDVREKTRLSGDLVLRVGVLQRQVQTT